MIHPHDTRRHAWDFLVVILVVIAGVDIPLRLVFDLKPQGWHLALDWITTVVFSLDILIAFRTARFLRGRLVSDSRLVARSYLRTWFLADFVSAVPFHLFLPAPFHILRMVRLLEFPALIRHFHDWEASHFINPNVFRLLFFACGVLLLAHWVGCGAIAIGVDAGNPEYVDAIYWSVTTLTTVGYGDISPTTATGKIYTMFVMCLGVGMYAYIIGTIATLIAEVDFARSQHQDQMERVNAFMRHHRLPRKLRDRIRGYYRYLWESRRGMDDTAIVGDLPVALRTEVTLLLLGDMLKSIPILEDASPRFLRSLAVHLEPCVYGPGDYVVRAGDTADRMFFVAGGRVEVRSEDESTLISTLEKGSHFGEIGLLSGAGRTANVRAVDFCDLYSLDQSAFLEVLESFPDFARKVREVADQRRGGPDTS